MPEPIYPKINPTTYLELADDLSSRDEPSAKRTAADRAYFSAFLTSRDLLAAKGYIEPYYSSDDHKYVSETLRKRQCLGAFGNQEMRLRRARNCVTYDTRDLYLVQPDVLSIDWMLETAKEIIKRVDELPRNPRKT